MKWKNNGNDTCTYFITATITEWKPLLLQQEARSILLDDLDFYRTKYDSRIFAYVIMPEHYHMVLDINHPNELHRWLRNIQGHSANELSKLLHRTASLEELSIYAAHANGSSKLAVWKEQARAVPITTEKVLRTKVDYIHNNPVNRKLVDHPGKWPYSSWRNYYLEDDSIFRIDRLELLEPGG